MIIVKLMGGVGNQLFQWALAKSLSHRFRRDVYIDVDKIPLIGTKRKFELHKFPFIYYNYNMFTNKNYTLIIEHSEKQTFNFEKDKNYYLSGYWQSESYFQNIPNTINHELKPTCTIFNKLSKFIASNNAVSLHVRRTDYLKHRNVFNLLTPDYYKKAIDVIGPYEKLLVFSDDIEWCKQNLHFKNMVFVEGNDSVTDLWLMSLCRDNIIANSSFSWWGAWLNDNTDKKVIAPNDWFLNRSAMIVPENWIKI